MIQGEFVHPYIDTELNEMGMELLVQRIINAEIGEELKTVELDQGSQRCDPDVSFEQSFTFRESEYEDLGNQQALIELLLAKDEEIWESEIHKLTDLLTKKRYENDLLLQEIDEICMERKRLQELEKARLQRLTEKEKMLIESIEKLKSAKCTSPL